jgi:CYTH domain
VRAHARGAAKLAVRAGGAGPPGCSPADSERSRAVVRRMGRACWGSGAGHGSERERNRGQVRCTRGGSSSLPGRMPEVADISRPAGEHLEAEHYDTDDLRLIRAGTTLRRRRGGDDAGWHLKLPVGADTRREIPLPLGRGERQVPGELAGLVRVRTRGEPVKPVAQVTTNRQRLVLLGQAGQSLAEVAADDVSAQTLGDITTVFCWHGVEVELTGGDRELLAAADSCCAVAACARRKRRPSWSGPWPASCQNRRIRHRWGLRRRPAG